MVGVEVMAIHLMDSNQIIIEIPKTGTTWIRTVCDEIGIRNNQQIPQKVFSEPRHSPLWCYLGNYSRAVCTVRRIIPWLETMWKQHQILPDCDTRKPALYHKMILATQPLFPIYRDFERWIDSLHPDSVYLYFMRMTRGCSGLIHYENLVHDLAEVLGVDASILESIPPVNVSAKMDLHWKQSAIATFSGVENRLFRKSLFASR